MDFDEIEMLEEEVIDNYNRELIEINNYDFLISECRCTDGRSVYHHGFGAGCCPDTTTLKTESGCMSLCQNNGKQYFSFNSDCVCCYTGRLMNWTSVYSRCYR